MPLLETKGAASAQGFGEFAKVGAATYIEDVFQTWLYTGNGTTNTITNGIDLSGKGGIVWVKSRSALAWHSLYYEQRKYAASNSSSAGQTTDPGNGLYQYNSNGFTLGPSWNQENDNGVTYASWTFRKQPKFFDVVTYTGNGANRTIAHSLDSVPGCIIVKNLSRGSNWQVYHRSLANTEYLVLNTTAAKATGATRWNSTTPTATEFSLGTDVTVNQNGDSFVAYLFAHDAGGFGLTGTDNVITCGSYTGNGSATGPTVSLGYEPQWLMIKNASGTGNWNIIDNMRGMPVGSADSFLEANTTDAEATAEWVSPTATGFNIVSTSSEVNTNTSTYIYIAIRRGPMKVPTSGTSVFSPNNSVSTAEYSVGFPNDWAIVKRPNAAFGWYVGTRLTGNDSYLVTNSTAAEVANTSWAFDLKTNFFKQLVADPALVYSFRRAPGFFDVVCYTGNGSPGRTVTHNLTVVPEMIIVKNRGEAGWGWAVYHQDIVVGASPARNCSVYLNTTAAAISGDEDWNNTAPTASVFSVGYQGNTNKNGGTYVSYLFATCAGVSKVGSYTGTGALQTVNCGFTSGARFVLIKRTDSTGDWYVYDSARGITSGNDPYLLLNSAAAEVTNTNYVDTDTTGFKVTAAAPAGLNANGGTYIFLAIA